MTLEEAKVVAKVIGTHPVDTFRLDAVVRVANAFLPEFHWERKYKGGTFPTAWIEVREHSEAEKVGA